MLLTGIMPIVFVPFDEDGAIDEDGLRRIVRFELENHVHALGINGFASEAYKLTDPERYRVAEIVASEVAGTVPLIIGIAAESTETAIEQANYLSRLQPAALMALPPSTMPLTAEEFVQHYVDLGKASSVPIMVQQAPHLPRYKHTLLSAQNLAAIHDQSPNVSYFKIEGSGSAERIRDLAAYVNPEKVGLFGGGGGITLLPELRAGAQGLIPGVGFNEYFLEAWEAWQNGNETETERLIRTVQPLVSAVSGPGHEFSLHARKHLMKRAGYIQHATVRRPTVAPTPAEFEALEKIADSLNLRIKQIH